MADGFGIGGSGHVPVKRTIKAFLAELYSETSELVSGLVKLKFHKKDFLENWNWRVSRIEEVVLLFVRWFFFYKCG